MTYESDYYVGADLNGDSLSHHGVPHQKWGVKNGPPYPIQRGHDVRYNVGKMTSKTKSNLQKSGKIKGSSKSSGNAAGDAAKKVSAKVSSSFQKWKDSKKMELATKDTNSTLMKNWQKKQLRISDMTNEELKQRIERKRLEEGYRRALRGDFSDSKNWKNSKQTSNGENVAKSILKKVGSAAIEGIAQGLTSKISNSMTAKSKGKIERKEARKKAMADVATAAAKERAEYRAEQRNADWKARQDQKREYRERTRYDDGAMDPLEGVGLTSGGNREYSDYQSYYTPTSSANYYTPTNSTGIATSRRRSSDYYRARPGSWTIR